MGYSFLDHGGPLALAHRGGAGEAPENSWAALTRAIDEIGYRYIETDVRLSADGHVALLHDASLDRTTDLYGPISGATAAQLAQGEIQGPNGQKSKGVPLLMDVLERWPDVRFNIDAKDDAVVEPLANLLRRQNAIDRVCVGSFSDSRVKRIRNLLGPTLGTVCGVNETARLRMISYGLPLRFEPLGACLEIPTAQKLLGPVTLSLVDRRLIEAAHRRGLAVIVWTIDDEADMRRLLAAGVDGIITDRPTVLKNVLVDLGRWHR